MARIPNGEDIGRLVRLGIVGARRIVVTVIGATVLLAGLAMLLLPGPGLVFVGIALAILSTEFVWARRFLRRVRAAVEGAASAGPSPDETDDPNRSTRPGEAS